MKNIAIIPARSGSKGLKDKNIMPLNGKPLMAYTIEAALESQLFDTVMVSTDSDKYAQTAAGYGACVPFLRSLSASMDTASSWDVVKEVLGRYRQMGKVFDTFCMLQPTSPLRTAEDLVSAYRLYAAKNAIAVVSVCRAVHPAVWYGTLDEDAGISGFIKRENALRRQEQDEFYRINGAVYIADVREFLKDSFLYRKGGYAYIMPLERSVDIDKESDFMYAQYLMAGRDTAGQADAGYTDI